MFSLGRFFGVPIFIAPSWLFLAIFFTLVYGPVLRHDVPGLSASSAYGAAIGFSILLALCVLAHELGHTAMSIALKQPVRRVVIFLMGGVSEMDAQLSRPRDELLVAGAGPAVSILITGAAFAGYSTTSHSTLFGALLMLLFWTNLAVTAFNILPGLPLDGGRVLRAALTSVGVSNRLSTSIAAWSGRAVAAGVLILGVSIRDPQWGTSSAVLSAVLAFYLWVGAGRAERLNTLLERIPQLRLVDLLRPGLFVPDDTSVAEALHRAWSGSARGLVTTDSRGQLVGIVDEARIGAVPLDQRPWTKVAEVSRPIEQGLILPVELEGQDLVSAVRATPSKEYFVVNKDGSPAGILSSIDLAAALQALT